MGLLSKLVGVIVGAVGGTVIGYGLFVLGVDLGIPGWPFIAVGAVIGFVVAPASESESRTVELNEYQEYELQKVAERGKNTTTLVTAVFPPAGYYLVGKTGIAALCFFTAHFGLIGHIVGPWHTRRVIKKARQKLDSASSS